MHTWDRIRPRRGESADTLWPGHPLPCILQPSCSSRPCYTHPCSFQILRWRASLTINKRILSSSPITCIQLSLLIGMFFFYQYLSRYCGAGSILQIVSIFRRDEANPISGGLLSKVTSFYKIGIRGIKSQCLVLSPEPIHFWNSVILPSDFISRGLQSLFRNDVMLRKLWKVIVVSHWHKRAVTVDHEICADLFRNRNKGWEVLDQLCISITKS